MNDFGKLFTNLSNRAEYRKRFKANPDDSGNPKYAKIGKRTAKFAALPSLDKNYKHKPKERKKEHGRFVTKKELAGILRYPERTNLIDAGYEIILSPTASVRKVKVGAVSRYMVKGF
jgi:hypothetical protein